MTPTAAHTQKSYAVAGTYVAIDSLDKARREYSRSGDVSKSLVEGSDALVWQTFASVVIPGFTINRVVKAAKVGFGSAPKLARALRGFGPTLVGLAVIPFIIHPIDWFVVRQRLRPPGHTPPNTGALHPTPSTPPCNRTRRWTPPFVTFLGARATGATSRRGTKGWAVFVVF